MKILIVIGPAQGVLNHTLALSFLLEKSGGHEVVWLTGEESRGHLERMKSPFRTIYSSTHDLQFNANNPGNVPHFIYSCEYKYLKECVRYEAAVISEIKPDLIITKHHYSPTLSSKRAGIPYAYYYTDGAEYLFPHRNPHNRWSSGNCNDGYQKLVSEMGLIVPKKKFITEYLTSPYLNIIRGIPLLSSLGLHDLATLKKGRDVFAGVLTYDGPGEECALAMLRLVNENIPLVYITFGSHCYKKDNIVKVLHAVKDIHCLCVLSTLNLDKTEILDCPPNVLQVPYIPNRLILERASLIIHHGGYGTTLSSFFMGVPQLVIPSNPNYTAQIAHCNVLRRHECGMHFLQEDLTAESLDISIRAMLEAPQWRRKAHLLREKIIKENLSSQKQFLLHLSNLKNLSLKEFHIKDGDRCVG